MEDARESKSFFQGSGIVTERIPINCGYELL
jgi:hypothetical protein